MNQNPQASNPEFQTIDVSEYNPYMPVLSSFGPFPGSNPAYNDHNWQFRKMRPTCFGDRKNTPAGPNPLWRKKDNEGD